MTQKVILSIKKKNNAADIHQRVTILTFIFQQLLMIMEWAVLYFGRNILQFINEYNQNFNPKTFLIIFIVKYVNILQDNTYIMELIAFTDLSILEEKYERTFIGIANLAT